MTRGRGWGLALGLLLLPAAAPAQRVAVISDLNGSYGSTTYEPAVAAAVARLVALRPDLVIITGDMVAGQRLHPPLPAGRVDAMWAAFHATVTGPLRAAGIAVAVTPGNHDASAYPRFTAERAAYRAQWAGRDLGLTLVDRGDYPLHYAFAAGETLFLSLDVTTVGALDPAQRDWAERVLAEHGPRYRHHVAFGHLPIHAFTRGRETEITADHDLEALLARHGVDLYLSGHHHAFYPGFHGGLRQVSQACVGAGPRRLLGTEAPTARAITLIEPDDRGGLAVGAVTGPAFDRPVDLATLPPSVGVLVRDDLRPGARP